MVQPQDAAAGSKSGGGSRGATRSRQDDEDTIEGQIKDIYDIDIEPAHSTASPFSE